jgi:hypothetical protein
MTGSARVAVDREPTAVTWGRRIGAWLRLHSWQAGW